MLRTLLIVIFTVLMNIIPSYSLASPHKMCTKDEAMEIELRASSISSFIQLYQEFKNYQETVVADRYWGEQADKATKMVGKVKSEEFLKSFGK